MEKLALSHGLQLGDALIAATGIEHQLTLLTANTKHFSVVDGLQLERFEPGEPAP
jgi:predicted nucleic acid-binding protein